MTKKKMKLSKRLQAVAAYAAPCKVVADVGTDHGYIPIYLVENGLAQRAVALDVNEGPLLRAREHVLACGLEDKIELRCSDGLERLLPGEADVIVIAGMGGLLTIRILQDGLERARCATRLVLSPQSDLYEVRRFLWKQGFVIADEDMVLEDGKFYHILSVAYSGKEGQAPVLGRAFFPPPEGAADQAGIFFQDGETEDLDQQLNFRFGGRLLEKRNPLLKDYLLKERNQYFQVREKLKVPATEIQEKRLAEVERELALIEDGLARMERKVDDIK